jgi:hypothetical protein
LDGARAAARLRAPRAPFGRNPHGTEFGEFGLCPMGPDYLTALIRSLGIPTTVGRTSAIRRQVLEMPSPVVADALGYHPVTTARLATQTAATFSRYAPGDHARPSPGRRPGKGEQ